MLDMCGNIGCDLCVNFNSNKSKCLVVGPNKLPTPEPMKLNNADINWTNSIKYLGITITTGKCFKTDLTETRRKFFMSVNGILSKCKFFPIS